MMIKQVRNILKFLIDFHRNNGSDIIDDKVCGLSNFIETQQKIIISMECCGNCVKYNGYCSREDYTVKVSGDDHCSKWLLRSCE
ncbi:MAG: hypothetical protein GY928_33550 [Colwellia sp.]|nr:hypothetical protein [Colwellia sp.]